MSHSRSSLAIAIAVCKALFLREAVARLSAGRAAWLWILLEPVAHLVFLMTLFGFILHSVVSGINGAMFIATGLLGYFMARNTATRCMEAINANTALFAYRQVLPVDTVLVRATLEGFVALLSALVLLAGASLFGFSVIPYNPLVTMAAVGGLWLSGTGLGLILSVMSELVPEIGKLVRLMFTPLYFISGVMFPALAVPQPYRDWMFLNPFLHGLEILRDGFFSQFHAAPEASLSYLYGFALIAVFFGLALHVRFAQRMVTQ
jgi:capsular polysaccharide transport system permease protein